jgi:hypothetical protein
LSTVPASVAFKAVICGVKMYEELSYIYDQMFLA